jgi:hypothetical protein
MTSAMVPRAPPIVTSPPVLKSDWETLARLAYRWSKPSNLNTCPTPSSLYQFCGATDKLKSAWFWGIKQETVALILRSKLPNRSCRFWCPNRVWCRTRENRHGGFETKPLINCPSGFETKPLTNHRPWFWGSTKKHTLLIFTCTVQTAHSGTRLLNHSATEYPTYVTILDPLHHVSYSCHDVTARHTTPVTCTPRDKQMWFFKWKKIKIKLPKCPEFEFNPWHVNDSSHIKPRYWPLGFSHCFLFTSIQSAELQNFEWNSFECWILIKSPQLALANVFLYNEIIK